MRKIKCKKNNKIICFLFDFFKIKVILLLLLKTALNIKKTKGELK